MTLSAVLNFHTYAAQVVGRLRQAWMQSHASSMKVSIGILGWVVGEVYVPLISGKVKSTSLTTPVTSKPLTSEGNCQQRKFRGSRHIQRMQP
jgi:hypothetical protein